MIQDAIRTLRTLLPRTGSVTEEQIESAVDMVMAIPLFSGVDRALLTREVQSSFNIRMDDFTIIESRVGRRPWVSNRKSSVQWNFWNRYRDYLEIEKNFAPEVLVRLDRLTDRILDGLFDPVQNAPADKKGLVVGQVQSGKTSNYTGLICKAADAGYKLIIVLAGIHNNLRSQTQLRIDEGFLGFDTQHQRAVNQDRLWIGVGRINQRAVAHSLTSSLDKGDFTAGAANSLGMSFNATDPIIAVVKKNARVLERLHRWLNAHAVPGTDGKRVIRSKSLLLIDDEADNASINTNPQDDPSTRINGLIRSILRLFDRSGYVGYTATPFANIFIPITEDDLFPKDFIINLPAPSNYIGPEKVFGFELTDDNTSDSVLPIIRRIDDHLPFAASGQGRDAAPPSEVPESLRTAIKCFIITCAIRRFRGQATFHNSMLIHVSRFIMWQRNVKDLVENVFDFYRRGIEMNIPSVIEEVRQAFEVDTETYQSYTTTSLQILDSGLRETDPGIQVHSWEEILPFLNEAASRIQIREINGGSADVLNYYEHQDSGLSVIAIGGDKLSRGLTLEGLSVSYYLRASRMYDTLMQMGRWFGYRPGYADLCRLFISRDLNEWYCHITLASQQLRDEFDYLADVAGSTPNQYALRIRTHPGVLQISASNRIRRAVEVRVSWSGRLVESYELSKKEEIIQENFNAALDTIQMLGSSYESGRNFYLWRNAGLSVIKGFLRNFETYENLKRASPTNILRFIEMNERYNELNSWAVGVISKERTDNRRQIDNLDIGLIRRTQDDNKSIGDLYYIRKSHIISPEDEFIDLTDEERTQAESRTRQLWIDSGKQGVPSYPSGEVVRNTVRKPNRPLLLIYFLDPEGAGGLQSAVPVVGYAISFPATDRDDAVSFAVHEQLLEQFNQQDEPELIQQDDED